MKQPEDRRQSEIHADGMAVRRSVLGHEHVDRAIQNTDEFNAEFQDFIIRYAWGEIWSRPGLDRKTRSCMTLCMLVALQSISGFQKIEADRIGLLITRAVRPEPPGDARLVRREVVADLAVIRERLERGH